MLTVTFVGVPTGVVNPASVYHVYTGLTPLNTEVLYVVKSTFVTFPEPKVSSHSIGLGSFKEIVLVTV